MNYESNLTIFVCILSVPTAKRMKKVFILTKSFFLYTYMYTLFWV